MGEVSEWIEASGGNRFGSCETHTKNLSRRQKENRGCRTSTLGEVPGGEEKGGVAVLVASPVLFQIDCRTPRQIEPYAPITTPVSEGTSHLQIATKSVG